MNMADDNFSDINLPAAAAVIISDQEKTTPTITTIVQLPLPNHQSDQVSSLKSISVFRGRSFCFSTTFPDVQRAEIVRWIREGGGKLVDTDRNENINVNYIVEAHGVQCTRTQFDGVTNVSIHWIWCCLQDGWLVDVSSHILFSPLQCEVPLPGFTGHQFFVSHYHYEKRSRDLLINLCDILGGELVSKLTKEVDYLICEFAEDPEYEAARAWGPEYVIHIVTSDWIMESIKQNKVVDSTRFFPKDTASDREAGIFINPCGSEDTGINGASSKHQTESEVVVYEEDFGE